MLDMDNDVFLIIIDGEASLAIYMKVHLNQQALKLYNLQFIFLTVQSKNTT